MAYLHRNSEMLKDAIITVSNELKITPSTIEKDYYVTIILRELSEAFPDIVFKGGTSLTKCYHAIKRFSEDIDITTQKSLSQSEKRELKYKIFDIANKLGLKIDNKNSIRSKQNYNRYEISYDSNFKDLKPDVEPKIILETSLITRSFPVCDKEIDNYLRLLIEEEYPEKLMEFKLDCFSMKVQSIERTFIDKVFAICDYYMTEKIQFNSRHLYDIHKLFSQIQFNDAFKNVIQDIRNERMYRPQQCPSAQDGVKINSLLTLILNENIYKNDYEQDTIRLLQEEVKYEETIDTLKKIIDTNLFE